MADELKLSITLDTKNVEQGFQKIEKSSEDASKKIKGNLEGSTLSFTEELTEVAGKFAIVSAAAVAFGAALKSAVDFAVLGEATKAVETRFNALAKSAGVAASELKAGIEAATDGLLDDEDALQIASKALVAFGKEAARLPQILEAARSASKLLGLDLKTSFESFSTFIQTGSERVLRQFGLVVELDEAYKAFALSIGKTVEQLTEQERQTVRINTLLEETAEKFGDVDGSVTPLAEEITRLNVSLGNLAEDSAIKFDNIFGPAILRVVTKLNDLVNSGIGLKDLFFLLLNPSGFFVNVAKGADNSVLSVSDLNLKIAQTTNEIITLENRLFKANQQLAASAAGDVSSLARGRITIAELTKDLLKARTQLTEFQNLLSLRQTLPPPRPPLSNFSAGGAKNEVEQSKEVTKLLAQEEVERAKFFLQSAQFRFDNAQKIQEAANIKTLLSAEQLAVEQGKIEAAAAEKQAAKVQIQRADAELAFKELEVAKLALKDQFLGKQLIKEEEYKKLEQSLEQTYLTNVGIILDEQAQRDKEIKNEQKLALDELTKKQEEFQEQLKETGKQIKLNIGFAFANAIGSAVNALINGENAFDAFTKAALNGIGDIAIQYGALFILQGSGFAVLPGLQPSASVLLSQGAGLLALGAVLKLAGASINKSSSSPAATSGTSGGGIVATPGPGTELVPPEELERLAEQTQVQVIVEGSIFDSDGTSTRIIELINEAFDKKGVVIQRGAFA